MRTELREAMTALPSLRPLGSKFAAIPCKICGSSAQFFDVVDFWKCASGYSFGRSGISVEWFRCIMCDFLFTPFFDDWSDAELTRFVYNEDYARVDPEYSSIRPLRLAESLSRLLGPFAGLRILDYGSGAGVMVEAMREHGYDAWGYDPFSSPERPQGLFDLVTCFEVIEHSPNPVGLLRDIRSLLKDGGGVIFGENLQPPEIDDIRCNWWYCAPRNGHCSTFSARTLAMAAEAIGLSFRTGRGRHAFLSEKAGQISDLIENITGPRFVARTLSAPASPQANGWHGVESPASDPFRWTARGCVEWQVPLTKPATLDIRIPLQIAIHPEFISECRIVVGGRDARPSTRPGSLVAVVSDVMPEGGVVRVEMRTPEPRSPRELRGVPDDRKLGLAISVGDDLIM